MEQKLEADRRDGTGKGVARKLIAAGHDVGRLDAGERREPLRAIRHRQGRLPDRRDRRARARVPASHPG